MSNKINFNDLRDLMIESRSVRRFYEEGRVSDEVLRELVELTRYCPSGRNAQPLRYVAVTDDSLRERIFPLLKWAGYYENWDGPEPGERPAAYLVQCLDTEFGKDCLCDDGLQLEAIMLGMHTRGLGGCIIKAFNSVKLAEVLNLPERCVPRYVYAIGYPKEHVRLEDMPSGDKSDFKYYRTPDGIHHVPKRLLSDLIIEL